MGQQQVGCDGHPVGAVEEVLAAALEAYICIDPDGRVVAWSPAAEATFGYPREQACGCLVEDLIVPAGARAAHRAGVARVAAGEPGRVLGQRLQLTARHADGHEFPIELSLTATDGPAGRRFHAFAHDITVTVRAQRFTQVEAAVSRGLADAASSAQAAERVVQALGVTMCWPVVELWLVDDTRQVLVCAARYTTRDVKDFCLPELEYGIGLPGTVAATGRQRWIPDLAADTTSLRSRLAARYGLRVAVGVPISSGGTLLGALAVYGQHVEDPEDSLTALLAGVAAHTGQYLERRRAEELSVELARTKDEFLALVTHELRNPLSVITNTAALFDDELDELSAAQQREYLRISNRSAERLAAMAGDLLDLARLESGHPDIDPAATDLAQVVADAVQAATIAATSKRLTVHVDTTGDLVLHADAARLRQVADNLLGNAIKYTPAGGSVTVTALSADDGEGEACVVWTVADTGIGIPATDRPKLFRRFYRASTALQHRIPGTGLGLVVTRAIIERHHGTITVTDHDGPGTTFVITLPVKPPT
jgi:PAS domain S-box-containing protein